MKTVPTALLTGVALFVQHVPAAEAVTESVVYSFQGGPDGDRPEAGLINVGGTLYGTTSAGGAYDHGTVFSYNSTTGVESVLYSFRGGTDGDGPEAGLISVNGELYGTTVHGGTDSVNCDERCGTVFKVNLTTGTETVVYSFCSQTTCDDGAYPYAGLIDVGGTLHGTTSKGGQNFFGTVFQISPETGNEKTLHSFDVVDGAFPYGGLINVGGTLYGTTNGGSANNNDGGTVFSLDPTTGAETVVYSFQGVPDGAYPYAGVVNVGGILYGTTYQGGAYGNSNGSGTVFELNPTTGTETVLYSFCRTGGFCADGAGPYAGLISPFKLNGRGTLYGTTAEGGVDACFGGDGCGTVFKLNPTTGAETVVYSFCSQAGCTDGNTPEAGLLNVKGTLYGTTLEGGAHNLGTVFKITQR